MAAARCVLALACLIFQLYLAPVDFVWFTTAIALFFASSLVAVMRSEVFEGTFGLLALFIDTVFFMLLAWVILWRVSSTYAERRAAKTRQNRI